MFRIFVVLLFVAIVSAAQGSLDNNIAQLNQLTEKMFDGDLHTNTKSLGFIYDLTCHQYICGVVLITTFFVLTDGSCITEETDLGSIQIHLKAYADITDRPVFDARKRIKIPYPHVNVIFVVLDRYVVVNERFLKQIPLNNADIMQLNNHVQVGWNRNWLVREDEFDIERIDGYKLHINSNFTYEVPLKERRGELLIVNGKVAGISVLSQDPMEHILYVNMHKLRYAILLVMVELNFHRPQSK